MIHAIQMAFLSALALMLAVIALRLFRSTALGRGLLSADPQQWGEVKADRVQLLAVACGSLGYLLFTALPLLFAKTPPTSLPEMPEWLLVLAGGSQAVYLGGKGYRQFQKK